MQKLLLTNIFILTIFTSTFAGGGWTQKKGEGYFKLNESFIRADEYYGNSGNSDEITTFSLYTTSLYAEYGFTDKLTAFTYIPFLMRPLLNNTVSNQTGNQVLEGDEYTGIGDFDLGVDYSIYNQNNIAISGRVQLGLPIGNTEGGKTKLLQTGDGEFNQLFQLNAGYGFGSVYFGYNNRTKDFSDELRYGAEVFLSRNKVYTAIKYQGIKSLENGSDTPAASSGIFSNNLEYDILGFEAGYQAYKNFGVSTGVFLAPFSGRNILDAPNFNLGIYYLLKK